MSRRSTSSKASKTKQPGGEPRYRREYAKIAGLICKYGATPDEVAEELGVDEATIKGWMVKHKEFADACCVGDEYANRRVERSVYQRACGYTRKVQKVVKEKGLIRIVEIEEYVPADVSFAELWLTNRCAGRWRPAAKTETGVSQDGLLVAIAKAWNNTGKRPKED